MGRMKIKTDREFTWDQYLDRVKTRSGQSGWGDASMTEREPGWTADINDLDGAIAMAEQGWPEGTQKMLQDLEHDSAGDLPSLFPSREYDIAGEFPDVLAYVAGAPDHMVSLGEASTGISPVIRLGVNGGARYSISSDAIMRFGAAVLSHAAAFQRAGYSVAIDWIKVAVEMSAGKKKRREMHLTRVELLTAGAVLDIDRAAFVLSHPAMLRRFWFADIEMEPEAKALEHGYGISYDAPKGWYPGIALPTLNNYPDDPETATVEEFTAWVGEHIERHLHPEESHAEAA